MFLTDDGVLEALGLRKSDKKDGEEGDSSVIPGEYTGGGAPWVEEELNRARGLLTHDNNITGHFFGLYQGDFGMGLYQKDSPWNISAMVLFNGSAPKHQLGIPPSHGQSLISVQSFPTSQPGVLQVHGGLELVADVVDG